MSHKIFNSVMAGPIFGAQTSGDVTISGTTTLTANAYYQDLTIATGGKLITRGFILRARKIIIQGTGKIHNNGIDAAGPTYHSEPGAGWAATPDIGVQVTPPYAVSTPLATGPGTAGVAGGIVAVGAGGASGAGGAGGTGLGSSATGGAGAAAGSVTALRLFPYLTLPPFLSGSTLVSGGSYGASGGSGGGDGVYAYSGGGSGGPGSGGGILAIYCEELDVSTAQAGCLTALGGMSNPTHNLNYPWGAGNNGSGGGGGTGGSGGGYVYIVAGKITGTLTNAVQCTGGTGRNGGWGNPAGAAGGGGGAGGNADVYNYATGVWKSARGSAGVAGTAAGTPSAIYGGIGGAGGACNLSL